MSKSKPALYCSFCGKSQHDVKTLIAGPKVHICDECVDNCIEVLGEDKEWCGQILISWDAQTSRPFARAKPAEQVPPDLSRGWLADFFAEAGF